MFSSSETVEMLWEVLAKFVLATILAGAIGLERERKGRAAGLRTHVLVCLGSTLSMVVSDVIAGRWAVSGAPIWLDQGRIAAGVLTGVGFLGAGTIINVGGLQRGLTTAAMIWFVAALGIGIGAGLYGVAGIATVIVLVLVVGLESVEKRLPSAERYTLVIEIPTGLDLADDLGRALHEHGFALVPTRLRASDHGESIEMAYEIVSRSRPHPRFDTLIKALLAKFPSIRRIECKR